MKSLVVTLADRNYVNQVKQLFSSLYFNAGWDGDCMLLSDNIPQEKLTWFKERGIIVKECEPFYKENVGVNGKVVFSKLHLFSEEYKKWDHIIYLDGDILIRDSIEDLTKVEEFSAVRIINDVRTRFIGQFWKYDSIWLKKLKQRFDLSRPAFNSGVMAFPTSIIKKDTIKEFKDIIEEYKEIICISEETVLNIYFYDRWKELPAVYNICPNWERGFRKCKPEELKGIILHCYSTFFLFHDRRMWGKSNAMCAEWEANLAKADQVNFRKPIKIKKNVRDIRADSKMILNLESRHPFLRLYRIVLKKIESERKTDKVVWKEVVSVKDSIYRLNKKIKNDNK